MQSPVASRRPEAAHLQVVVDDCLRVLLTRYSLVASEPQAQQGARPVVRSPVAARRPEAAHLPVVVGDCLRDLSVSYLPVYSAQRVLESQARLVLRSPVAVRGFHYDSPGSLPQVQLAARRLEAAHLQVVVGDCLHVHSVHCSLVVSSLPLPAPALSPAAARSVVVVHDCLRVHPKHCFPDVRRVQSTPLERAYPAAPA